MTEDEFRETQKFLRKFVLHLAPTTMDRLGYALDDRFYGIKGSHLENFRRAMDEVTLADVNAAIKKYLQYDNIDIAIVTKDAESLKKALVDDAPSPITYRRRSRNRCWPKTAKSAFFRCISRPRTCGSFR